MLAQFGYWLRRIFGADGLLLVVSILLAVLLWLYVNDELSAEREIVAPLRIEVPGQMALQSGEQAAHVRVRVRGPKRTVELLGPLEVRGSYRVDPNTTPGPLTLKLAPGNFIAPPEVMVTQVVEDQLPITLVQTSGKAVRVKVVTRGSPKEGFELAGSPLATPSEVVIIGPSEELKDVDSIETEPVDLDGQSGVFSRRVGLARSVKVGDKAVAVQCAEAVEVAVRLREETAPRVFPGIWIRALVPADMTAQVAIKPPLANVKVQGERRRIAQLRQEDIRLYVDLAGIAQPGPQQATLQVQAAPIQGATISGEAGALPTVSVNATFSPASKEPPKQ